MKLEDEAVKNTDFNFYLTLKPILVQLNISMPISIIMY